MCRGLFRAKSDGTAYTATICPIANFATARVGLQSLRLLRLILAIYVFAWLNIIVPGHTRGAITVAGSEKTGKTQLASCCSTSTSKSKDGNPTPDQKQRCGVCFVAAIYTIPVIYRFHVDLLELTQILHDRAVSQLLKLDFPTPFWPVGPPVGA
jgi:hypothetical protein